MLAATILNKFTFILLFQQRLAEVYKQYDLMDEKVFP
jgi:hypothetical protein